jgi:hypothetical protein
MSDIWAEEKQPIYLKSSILSSQEWLALKGLINVFVAHLFSLVLGQYNTHGKKNCKLAHLSAVHYAPPSNGLVAIVAPYTGWNVLEM